jgi:hypothetical protein
MESPCRRRQRTVCQDAALRPCIQVFSPRHRGHAQSGVRLRQHRQQRCLERLAAIGRFSEALARPGQIHRHDAVGQPLEPAPLLRQAAGQVLGHCLRRCLAGRAAERVRRRVLLLRIRLVKASDQDHRRVARAAPRAAPCSRFSWAWSIALTVTTTTWASASKRVMSSAGS